MSYSWLKKKNWKTRLDGISLLLFRCWKQLVVSGSNNIISPDCCTGIWHRDTFLFWNVDAHMSGGACPCLFVSVSDYGTGCSCFFAFSSDTGESWSGLNETVYNRVRVEQYAYILVSHSLLFTSGNTLVGHAECGSFHCWKRRQKNITLSLCNTQEKRGGIRAGQRQSQEVRIRLKGGRRGLRPWKRKRLLISVVLRVCYCCAPLHSRGSREK